MTLRDLGNALRQHRESLGFSIDDISLRTKITPRTLEAIENGIERELPHTVYLKGFIRTYALSIGIDPQDIQGYLDEVLPTAQMNVETQATTQFRRAAHPRPSVEPSRNTLPILILALLTLSVFAGAWYVYAKYGDLIFKRTQPTSVSSPVTEDLSVAVSSGAEQHRNTAPAQAQQPIPTPAQPQPQPAAVANVQQVQTQAPTAIPSQSIVITAKEICYINFQIDNTVLRHYTLKPKETYTINFANQLKLHVRNAGAVNISFNGKDMGTIGAANKSKDLVFP